MREGGNTCILGKENLGKRVKLVKLRQGEGYFGLEKWQRKQRRVVCCLPNVVGLQKAIVSFYDFDVTAWGGALEGRRGK